jgi:hypothetical protein
MPIVVQILRYAVTLGAGSLLAFALGLPETLPPYAWGALCASYAVFTYPICAYGWFEFIRPRQYWILPVGTLLAAPIGALLEMAMRSYPMSARTIFINGLILPFLPYLLITRWRFIHFVWDRLREWLSNLRR